MGDFIPHTPCSTNCYWDWVYFGGFHPPYPLAPPMGIGIGYVVGDISLTALKMISR